MRHCLHPLPAQRAPDKCKCQVFNAWLDMQSKQAKNDMSALQYRINARNALTGRTHLAVAYQSASQTAARGTDLKRSSAPPTSDLDQVPKLMFASEEYRVLESQRGLRVMVHCARCACTLTGAKLLQNSADSRSHIDPDVDIHCAPLNCNILCL